MRIIAFITETPTVRHILDHIAEPSAPPLIAVARGPPAWDMEEAPLEDPGEILSIDPEPEYNYDQSRSW
jgi:hypothetical protein